MITWETVGLQLRPTQIVDIITEHLANSASVQQKSEQVKMYVNPQTGKFVKIRVIVFSNYYSHHILIKTKLTLNVVFIIANFCMLSKCYECVVFVFVVGKTTARKYLLGFTWPGTKWRTHWCLSLPSFWWKPGTVHNLCHSFIKSASVI